MNNNEIESLDDNVLGTVKPLTQPSPLGSTFANNTNNNTSFNNNTNQKISDSQLQPNQYKANQQNNAFTDTTLFNGENIEVGITPPENEKKKKNKKGLIFIIIIFVLIIAIGLTIYYILNKAKKETIKGSVTINKISIEIGNEIPTNIKEYAIFNDISSSSCTLNTTKIDKTKVGNYEFVVTCNKIEYKGQLAIIDTIKPNLLLKNKTKKTNDEINIEDFVEKCEEFTGCSYYYENDYDFTKEGIYFVKVNAKDSSGNVASKYTTLIVSDNDVPKIYLICSKNNTTDYIGIKSGSVIGKYSFRVNNYSIANEAQYSEIKNSYENNVITIQEYSGYPNFDDNNLKIELRNSLILDELKDEYKDLPNEFSTLKTYYQDKLEYTCTAEISK